MLDVESYLFDVSRVDFAIPQLAFDRRSISKEMRSKIAHNKTRLTFGSDESFCKFFKESAIKVLLVIPKNSKVDTGRSILRAYIGEH